MRRAFVFLTSLILLAACNTPGRTFRGEDATRIAVGDSLFDIRRRGELAEAIRLNGRYAPRPGPIWGEASFAMAQVTGCDVTGVLGDQTVITGVLNCGTLPSVVPVGQFTCVTDERPNSGAMIVCSPVAG